MRRRQAAVLVSYRVRNGYRPGAKTGKGWQAWFDGLGTSRLDLGYAVLATRKLGKLGEETRLGGYSIVGADDIDHAAALAESCPALQLGGGVEIGAVPVPARIRPTTRRRR